MKKQNRQWIVAALLFGLLILSGLSGLLTTVWNAVQYGFSTAGQAAPVVIEQPVGDVIAERNGDTAAQLTGYELVFPRGTVDWRIVYTARPNTTLLQDYRYTVLDPTYWCKMEDGRWLSCQPVIKPVEE